MPPTPVRTIEDALIALVLAGRFTGQIPSIRTLGLNSKTLNTALAGVLDAGYISQRENGRYEAATPKRMRDPELHRLAAELAAAAKRSGADLNDLGPLLAAQMLVSEAPADDTALRHLSGELRDLSSRSRRARNHASGDQPGTHPRRNRAVEDELRNDHG